MSSAAVGRRPSSAPDERAGARWVWGLAGTSILLAIIAAALAVWLLHQHQHQRLQALATSSSQLAAEQAQAIFNAARFRLQAARRELNLRADPRHWLRHPDELQALLAEITQASPERGLFSLGAIDPSGRIVALSVGPEARGTDVSDRPFFQALLSGADRVLSDPVARRAGGARLIPYAEWMRGETGEPVFVLTASIDLPFLERLYRGVMSDDLVVSALFKDDGTLVAGVWPSPALPPLGDTEGWILARTLVVGWPLIAVAGVPAGAVWQDILLPTAMIGGIVLLLGAGIVVVTQIWQQRRRAFVELLQVERQQEMLLRELNHRIKNTVAVVQGIALQTFRTSSNLEECERAFTGRLEALARASTLLGVESWRATELRTLAEAALEPHRGGGDIRLSGPEVLLPPKTALTLSLVLHELATNATKYGALSAGEGHVEVTWQVGGSPPEGRHLVLGWVERGGPGVSAPERRGFGCRLIERSVAYELDGEARLEFPPEGVRCRIELPLAARAD